MKTSVLIVTMGFSILLFLGCSEERVINVVQERDGLFYAVNEEQPFTGKLVVYSDSSKKNKQEEAFFHDGIRIGIKTTWASDGERKLREIEYKNGLKSRYTRWLGNGKNNGRKDEAYYENGELERMIGWYPNGQKRTEALYQDGEPHGLSTGWHENGRREYEANFNKGELVEKLCCND